MSHSDDIIRVLEQNGWLLTWYIGHFVLTISLDLTKSSEVRKAGDRPICKCIVQKNCTQIIILNNYQCIYWYYKIISCLSIFLCSKLCRSFFLIIGNHYFPIDKNSASTIFFTIIILCNQYFHDNIMIYTKIYDLNYMILINFSECEYIITPQSRIKFSRQIAKFSLFTL